MEKIVLEDTIEYNHNEFFKDNYLCSECGNILICDTFVSRKLSGTYYIPKVIIKLDCPNCHAEFILTPSVLKVETNHSYDYKSAREISEEMLLDIIIRENYHEM